MTTLFFPILLLLFSFGINFFYGSIGVLPIDTFAHFDTGSRILNGEVPFKDYWTTSGPFIDYMQSIYFYFFGISWFSYILNGSVINSIISLFTYEFFKVINLKSKFAFIYALCFSILANPSMGSPFVDHYSSFFSLLAIYSFLYAIYSKKNFFFFLVPILILIGFFCKQTPSAYIVLIIIFSSIVYFFQTKNISWLKIFSISSILSILLSSFYLIYNNIDLELFLTQYLYFPKTIAESRLGTYDLGFFRIVKDFKLIIIPIVILAYFTFFKNNEKKIEINITNMMFCLFSVALIFHQLLTWNFIFIFFLIPILCGIIQSNIVDKFKYKKIMVFFIMIFCVGSTLKFHERFNLERKMLKLENISLKKSIDSELINIKLKGLKWVTFYEYKNPELEIKIIKDSLEKIKKEKRNAMLISNLQFFESITKKKLNSPNRWFENSVAYPSPENDHYQYYILFLKNLIIEKKIKVIFIETIIHRDHDHIINTLLTKFSKNCSIKINMNERFDKLDISRCLSDLL
jgi:hypothetical protein